LYYWRFCNCCCLCRNYWPPGVTTWHVA